MNMERHGLSIELDHMSGMSEGGRKKLDAMNDKSLLSCFAVLCMVGSGIPVTVRRGFCPPASVCVLMYVASESPY